MTSNLDCCVVLNYWVSVWLHLLPRKIISVSPSYLADCGGDKPVFWTVKFCSLLYCSLILVHQPFTEIHWLTEHHKVIHFSHRTQFQVCGNKMPTRCNRRFLLHPYCLLNMFRAPLCPSSGAREYYTDGCCLWYLVLWFSSCGYGVDYVGYVSGLRALPANRTHKSQLHTIPTTWKPKHQIQQAATICIILSSSWWWA